MKYKYKNQPKLTQLITVFSVAIVSFATLTYLLVLPRREESKRDIVQPSPAQRSENVQSKRDVSQGNSGNQALKTDALTGKVTRIDATSISLKNEEKEITVNLKSPVSTYSISEKNGLVKRDFSDIKVGSLVTVEYELGTMTAKYFVIE